MKEQYDVSRRDFIKSAAAAAGISLGLAGSRPVFSSAPKETKNKIAYFTKSLQHLSYDETADIIADVGWDGIECPVRKRSNIKPERVEEDLPKMVEALKKRRLEITVLASDITSVDQPHTEKVLRTASGLGIKCFRTRGWWYKKDVTLAKRLSEVQAQLKDLVALSKELGIRCLVQNHSGRNRVGAAVWDLYGIIKDMDHKHIGISFDICHATIEGGLCWPTHFRLVRPLMGAAIAKDFYWKLTPGKGGKRTLCPLGEGMVDLKYYQMLKNSGYQGPIVQHIEYHPEGKNEEEKLKNHIKDMKKDYRVLKEQLAV